MIIRRLVTAILLAQAIVPACAGDRIDVTPPLYRERARDTASVRPASELRTTPSLVAAAPEARPQAGAVASAAED